MTPGQASMGKVRQNCISSNVFSYLVSYPILNKLLHIFRHGLTVKERETVPLGRELLGGNGILSDFLVAKVSFSSLDFRFCILDGKGFD
jgi:hypothetical protein